MLDRRPREGQQIKVQQKPLACFRPKKFTACCRCPWICLQQISINACLAMLYKERAAKPKQNVNVNALCIISKKKQLLLCDVDMVIGIVFKILVFHKIKIILDSKQTTYTATIGPQNFKVLNNAGRKFSESSRLNGDLVNLPLKSSELAFTKTS